MKLVYTIDNAKEPAPPTEETHVWIWFEDVDLADPGSPLCYDPRDRKPRKDWRPPLGAQTRCEITCAQCRAAFVEAREELWNHPGQDPAVSLLTEEKLADLSNTRGEPLPSGVTPEGIDARFAALEGGMKRLGALVDQSEGAAWTSALEKVHRALAILDGRLAECDAFTTGADKFQEGIRELVGGVKDDLAQVRTQVAQVVSKQIEDRNGIQRHVHDVDRHTAETSKEVTFALDDFIEAVQGLEPR
jgi:hypothetical protein